MNPTENAQPILQTVNLCKNFGALRVSDRVDLSVADGEVLALIGPNGAGKTTLIDQLSGILAPDSGEILFRGQSIGGLPAHRVARLGIGRSFQRTNVFPEFTLFENLRLAAQSQSPGLFRMWKSAAAWHEINDSAEHFLETVNLTEKRDWVTSTLSHGEQRMLELGMVLALRPRLLLLDEPMAGVSLEESQRITRLLLELKRRVPMVLVEHDMDVVFAVADRIAVLVYGQVIAVGTPESIRANPAVVEAYLGEA